MNMIRKVYRFAAKYLTAFAGCLYMLTVGFLFKKNRDLLAEISRHFGYPRTAEKIALALPRVHFSAIVPQPGTLKICELDYVRGNVSILELIIINQIIANFKPKRFFEFGTFDGRTTVNMAANSPDDAVIYTLDLPRESIALTKFELEKKEFEMIEKDTSGKRFSASGYAEKIKQLYGDSAAFDFSSYEGQMDFVFVDASHAYDYVLSDSKNALKMLNPKKGILIWHDYGTWNGVTLALNELQKEQRDFKDIKHIEGTSFVILMPSNI